MPPKGHKTLPKDMGNTTLNGNSWQAYARIAGRLVWGPVRTYKHEADADLAQAQQSVSQEQMEDYLVQARRQQLTAHDAPLQQGVDPSEANQPSTFQPLAERSASETDLQMQADAQNEAYSLRGNHPGGQSGIASRGTGKTSGNIELGIIADQSAAQHLAGIGAQEVEDAGSVSVRRPPGAGKVSASMASAQSLTGLRAVAVQMETKREEKRNELQEKGERVNLPQPLARRGSAAASKAARRQRQRTEGYKLAKRARENSDRYKFAKRARENTDKYRFAKAARRNTDEYRAKKRAYESGPQAKLGRQQRKLMKFWSPCFFNWGALKKALPEGVH